MPEGDTIHRLAARLEAALGGRVIEFAAAPSARSPLHGRAEEIEGRTLEEVHARGKHLLAHFSGDLVLDSHLGMSGRWRIRTDGSTPGGRPWLVLSSGPATAFQVGGRVLRVLSRSRMRRDPMLRALGPDPLAANFEPEAAARRLREWGAGREVGEALLDQRVLAGVGNAIRNEACFRAGISPWRPVERLGETEALALVREHQRVMATSMEAGRRPRSIYRGSGRPCPRCGERIRSRGQGDDNRIAYWCEACQA